MRISEREIQKSLKLLSEEPIGSGSKAEVGVDINHMILGQLRKLPDVRMDKVLPLRMAIQEHRYYIPEDKVAGMLLGRCLADHLR